MSKILYRAACCAALVTFLATVGPVTRPAFALDPGPAVDQGISPGDWAGGVIKQNADKWDLPGHVPLVDINVPYVGLSAGMYQILKHLYDDGFDDIHSKNVCEAAAIGVAWEELGNAIWLGAGLAAGQSVVDTTKAIAGLAGLPEAEIIGQVADQIKDSVKDAIKDKLKDIFKGEKPEVYYTTSVVGQCSVVVLAVWDKANNTFEVVIYGDCHCQPQSVIMSLQQAKLGTFSVKLSGTIIPVLTRDDQTRDTVTLSIHDNRAEVHANCNICLPGAPPMTAAPPPSTPPPATSSLKPPPRDVKTKCKECQPIVDRIVAVYGDLDAINIAQRAAQDAYNAAVTRHSSDVQSLEAQVDRLGIQELALKKELLDLAGKLAECEKNQCNSGHTVLLPVRPLLPGAVPPSTSLIPATETPPGKTCPPCKDIRDQIDKINQRMEQANKELEAALQTQRRGGNSPTVENARNQVTALTRELGTLQNQLDELTTRLATCEKSCDGTQEPPPRTAVPTTPSTTQHNGGSGTTKKPKEKPKRGKAQTGQTGTGTGPGNSDALRGLSIGIGVGIDILGGQSHGGRGDDQRPSTGRDR